MMLSPLTRAVALSTLILSLPQNAVAEDPGAILTFGLGGATRPAYFGSDDYEIGPGFDFQLNYLRLGGRNIGSTDPNFEPSGFGLRGAFGFVSERTADDNPELTGLDDIDAAFEVGLGLGYEAPAYRAFVDLRYGITGHDSFVGEIGADLKLNPSDRVSFTAGPRMTIGSDDYASTYFGVTAAESVASGLPAFDADGGLLSAGVELGMTYRFNDDWGLKGTMSYDRLMNDAEDSPITGLGDRDQFGAQLVVTRRVTFNF